jgi:cycloeucalenol cycloisomerase
LSENVHKRDGEWFFLWYSAVWIGFFALVLVFRLWEGISDLGYALIGLAACVPCVAIPLIWPLPSEARQQWYNRYSFKANIWVAAFNFIGNYFWTHYFFALLGASYTFPIKYQLNKIPPVCFLLTQPYFQTYHAFSNLILRYVRRKLADSNYWLRMAAVCLVIALVSLFWAFAETKTIESFPYYSFTDRDNMYRIGLTFYALYFIVSFPMFIRLDEDKQIRWDWSKTLIDSLAAAMIVFTLCDFWRLIIGNINPGKSVNTLPFLIDY